MLGIIKGDLRFTYLNEIIKDSILSNNLNDFYNIDKLLIPLNGINSDYNIKGTNINIKDIIKNNSINTIYTGNANKELIKLCLEHNITLYELLKDNGFVIENAYLTAKGIIHYMHDYLNDIKDYRVLVLGYGNIGFYICQLLKSNNTSFSVYTENTLEEKYILLNNYKLEKNITDDYDIIINTIPFNLNVDYSRLSHTKIYDVASSPYGFAIEEIVKNNIKYEVVSAIPSKYAPYSAAKIVEKYIKKIYK